MKKIAVLILLLTATIAQAHTLLMNVINNEDNTVTVVGEFSTGDSAAGALIRFESLLSGKILFKQRLPEDSELTAEIPKEPYQIVLDGGPGHTIVKEGIAPLEGFEKEIKAEVTKTSTKLSQASNLTNEWSNPTIILFILGLLLIILTLYISSKNTNKILKQIKQEG
ncbi:hypothetical protein [Halarcobacter anaerophilus]|uniref:Cobalt ABC transporter permease n=1 Tax=Halarcobacter anaerophilus TaxID=877500 RepID=A0A4Q0XVC6_9BACT|nr:hypothetical protein [Halarcobacter anaerophilus]QDF28020.1 putative membrane protein [Halarcobacter anaerophilus]RXJ61456.1 hypothetical protein CRV06_13600 [Halarcobacter anaerophilus]